jgi:hypothetical protein
VDNFTNTLFARLRTQAKPNLLRTRAGGAKQCREGIIDAADRINIVLKFVVRKGLDDHPCAIFCKRAANVCCSSDGVAHIVQTVKNGDKVVLLTWEVLRGRTIKDGAVGKALSPGILASSLDRLVVVVKAKEL